MVSPQDILAFWFDEISPKQWWVKDTDFDAMISKRFLETHSAAMRGELFGWRDTPEGRLAEVIVLDQFSRNMFRATPASFASDPLALVLAQEAIRCGDDQAISSEMKSFLYMPFMHSESLLIHKEALRLFEAFGNKGNIEFEKKHMVIIEKFGRYPHRNEILSRTSTPEEITFLTQPGSSF